MTTPPITPALQTLMWHGDSADGIVGSRADRLYVDYINADVATDGATLRLMQAGALPTVLDTIALPADFCFVVATAENDAGVIGLIAENCDTGNQRLFRVTHSGTSLSYTSFDVVDGVVSMWVSGDGAEFVLQLPVSGGDTPLYGYSMSGTLNWDCTVPNDGVNTSGYVAGVPRAGRFIWVNTAPPALNYAIGGTNTRFPVEYGEFDLAFDLPDLTGKTVTDVYVRVIVGWNGPFGSFPVLGYVTFGGTVLLPELAEEWLHGTSEANHAATYGAIPGVVSSVLVKATNDGFNYWAFADSMQFITVDNSEAGGSRIELRDDSGTMLDYVDTPDPFLRGAGEWRGTGTNRLAYVLAGAGGGET